MLSGLLVASLLLTRLDSPITERAEQLGREVLKNGHDPRAAATLIRLHSLMDELEDLNLLAEPYVALLYRRSTDEHVRTLARRFMADVERARGRTTKAQELMSELGLVQDFWVVGSFDNEGKSGCDVDAGPESALDLRASYPLRTRETGWRKPHARRFDGYVDLSLTLRPSTEAVAYAVTWLQADSELRAELNLGVSGGSRLWVNGVKVSSSDRYNLPKPDQQRVQVTLRKGLNRVLLKVCQLNGPLGFTLRAKKLDGQRGTLSVALPDVVPPLERGPAPQPVLVPTLTEVLERRLKATPNDHPLRADYARVLWFFRTYPESENVPAAEAARAALNAPTDLELQLLAAELHGDDLNERRRFLEAALVLDPTHPFARLALGQLELAREHPDRALRIAEALVTDRPLFAPALVLRLEALQALGEKALAMRLAEEAFRVLHVVPSIAREAVSVSRRADRPLEALERARAVIALRFDDVNARRGLAALLADLGRVSEAIEQYQKVVAFDPFDQQSLLRLAELLSANGRLDEGLSTFELLRRAAPDAPEPVEALGRVLLQANRKDEAIAAFDASLALKPQNPALKEMLRSLKGEDEAHARPEVFSVRALLEAEASVKASGDAVVLGELTHVKVQPSGLSSRFQQLVVKPLTLRGVEAWRAVPITWSPDRQDVRVLRARVTKPDGSVVDSFGEDERNINEPWTGMYYDARARVLSFPALTPGDVLEVQWRIEDTAVENLLSDYWGDVDSVQGGFEKRHYRYVVDMPASRPLSWNKGGLPAWVKSTVTPAEGRTLYRFEADDVPKVVPEPNMPGFAEVATVLHLSTYQNWEQVGRYYWGLVREQLVPNDELKKAVDQALKGVDRADTQKVVAAIYGFVVTNTRYVALEFGIHGYKPYRVDRILSRRFGDCKDKASLIHAMLKVAGVESRLVLLRMRHLGSLGNEVASLAAFNHAIAYVPKLDLFLDGTAEFHGSRELGSADRLANVLIVEPEAPSRFLTTPEAKASDNLTAIDVEVTLKLDGSASLEGGLVATGQGAPEVRRQYQTPATRQSTFEQQWGQSYPGLEVKRLTVSEPTALEQPVTMSYAVNVPRYAEAGPGLLRFFPFGTSRNFTQVLAPLSERSLPLLFPGVWVNELKSTYVLPAGFEPVVPEPVVESSAFGALTITAKREGAKLVLTGRLELSRERVEPTEYAAFREWLLRVDQAFGRKVLVRQGASTARALATPPSASGPGGQSGAL